HSPANPIRDRGPGHSKSGYTGAISTVLTSVSEGLAYSGRPYKAPRSRHHFFKEIAMPVILWLLGVPLSIVLLLMLFGVF
ncbi:hypothetical protein, partial [Acidovorax sp.]|uniref:hypothetical protein n=1 Tax=Acidovorax sp. TaxID=1872122 RepID=UPI003BAE1914